MIILTKYIVHWFLLIVLGLVANNAFAQRTAYNVFDYGAILDSSVVQTKAIQAAIDDCYQKGGGTVSVPSGYYKTGTLILKSNVNLHLEPGCVLFASESYIDFPMQPAAPYRSLKDVSGWSALIYAVGEQNISITGKGIIDGRGKGKRGRPGTAGGDADGRPRNILFISCKRVLVDGIEMRNAAMWNQHYLDCEDVVVNDVKVYNHANGNNDGIDIDGCRNFVLSNSVIDADDDAIVLKSTGTAACENVVINNCVVSSFANAIKCGTESTGGFKNIVIGNCVVKPSNHKGERVIKSTPSGITAISLEIVDGGIMDGVTINNIMIEGTECPLYIRLANRGRKHNVNAPQPGIGAMRNINISNVTALATGNFGSSITGIPGAQIENVYLHNIRFFNKGGLVAGSYTVPRTDGQRHDVAKHLSFDTYWKSYKDVIEDEKGYPQPTVWQNLPSYGLFIRHVNGISISQSTFNSNGSEPRNAIIAVNAEKVRLNDISVNETNEKPIVFYKVQNATVDKNLKVRTDK